jgi:hypothetical protein
VKRRALILGLLLMPTAARAHTSRQGSKKPAAKTAARPAPKPPTKSPPAKAAPARPQPVTDGKTQLVAFNASAFPYRGNIPGTNKPFLDVRSGRRRGHTTLRGDVCWEDSTYSDRRSLLYLPPGYTPQLPSLIVLYLHGQGATLERDVLGRQAIPRQIAASGVNAALVAPQLAYDAADSSAGNFWRPGHFAAYVDEAAERLMRLYGNDRRLGGHFNSAPVVIVAYSGGYLPTAYALQHGGAAHRIKGVILMDALYGDEDKFAAWIGGRRRQGFLLSAFSESTRDENAALQGLLAKRSISYGKALPSSLTPGTVAFVSCGGRELHGDFMTRAWTADPLKQALAMIPGYSQTDRGKKGT